MRTSVEATVIIIAACIPTLRPVFLEFTSGGYRHQERLEFAIQSGAIELHAGHEPNNKHQNGISTEIYSKSVRKGAEVDSMEEGILPPGAIRMTRDVYATHD